MIGEFDVAGFPGLFFIFEGNEDWIAGKRLEGEWCDELGGGAGHHSVHRMAGLREAGSEFCGFVGGDGTGDAEDDVHGGIMLDREPGSGFVLRSAGEFNVVVAVGGEVRADVGDGALGVVAIRAEVAEDHVTEAGMGDLVEETCGLIVGEVTVLGADSLFGAPGAFGVGGEEVGVVVGLDEEHLDVAQGLGHAMGDVAGIGEDAEFAGVGGFDHEADGVHGIVVNGVGVDGGVAEREGLPGFEEFP